MRSFLALTLIALLSVRSLRATDGDYTYDKDVQTLLKTAYFGFGRIGMTPNITEGEAALKRIMKKEEAIKFLFPVFDHGTPEGKCYALIGFRLLAPTYFESSCKRIARWNDSTIKTVAGCIVGDAKLAEVVQAIREGRYDDEALGKKRG
jgi:hypothetical protein